MGVNVQQAPAAVDDLERALAAMRESLAHNEQQLAGLMQETEATTDLQAELKRAQQVNTQRSALERVIGAQRRQVEHLAADLNAARLAAALAAVAQQVTAAEGLMAQLVPALWQVVDQAAAGRRIQTEYRQIGASLAVWPEGLPSSCEAATNLAIVERAVGQLLVRLGAARWDVVTGAGEPVQVLRPAFTGEELAAQEERNRKAQAEATARMAAADRKLQAAGWGSWN